MSLNISSILPTQPQTVTYRAMSLSCVSQMTKEKGIARELLSRVTAAGLVLLSTLNLLLATTRLALYTIFVVPLLMHGFGVAYEFSCALATLARSVAMCVHGHYSLILKTDYRALNSTVTRDLELAKALLLMLPSPDNDDEIEIFNKIVRQTGLETCLDLMFKNKRYDLVDDILAQVDPEREALLLLDQVVKNGSLEQRYLNTILHHFNEGKADDFVISILKNETISRSIKGHIAHLCQMETNCTNSFRAQQVVMNRLANKMYELAEQETNPAQSVRNLQHSILENNQRIQEVMEGLRAILRCSPDLLQELPEVIIQRVLSHYHPQFDNMIDLHEKNHLFLNILFEKCPQDLAECMDSETGESLIMYLLRKKDYQRALILLRQESPALDASAVIELLKYGRKRFKIDQAEMEQILEPWAPLITLYRQFNWTDLKDLDDETQVIEAIGVKLSSKSETVLDSLVTEGIIQMKHKVSPIQKQPLDDLPEINIHTLGLRLFDGLEWNPGFVHEHMEPNGEHIISMSAPLIRTNLINFFNSISTTRELNNTTKHILKWVEEQSDDDAKREMLIHLSTGVYACLALKQNLVFLAWNDIEREKQNLLFENDYLKKIDLYLSRFKEKVYAKIIPDSVHDRISWGKTLKQRRFVETAYAGVQDYFYGSVNDSLPQALKAFDQLYTLKEFISFLRTGLNDKKSKLLPDVSELIGDYLNEHADEREKIEPFLTTLNGTYTDLALLLVLLKLEYISLS